MSGGGRHQRPNRTLFDRMVDGVLYWPWFLLAGVAGFVLVLSLGQIPADLDASRGEGVLGTFTAAEDLGCGRSFDTGCSWSGDFVSDDGAIRAKDVTLFAGTPGHVGGTARVRFLESSQHGVVYLPNDTTMWIASLGVAIASSGYLVGFGTALVKRARQPR